MFHRHLSLEQVELAREEDPVKADRLSSRAAKCRQCAANLDQGGLHAALVAWTLPAGIVQPADWREALKHAIAPGNPANSAPRVPGRRLAAIVLAGAALTALAGAPVAASSGPDSVLYPVRGLEENARWAITSPHDRPRLEAELASGYLWQARVSAGRHDDAGYRASMNRFFLWGDRLKTDVKSSPVEDRPAIRATVSAAQSLLPELKVSSQDQQQNDRAQQVLNDVQAQSGDGDHQGNN